MNSITSFSELFFGAELMAFSFCSLSHNVGFTYDKSISYSFIPSNELQIAMNRYLLYKRNFLQNIYTKRATIYTMWQIHLCNKLIPGIL